MPGSVKALRIINLLMGGGLTYSQLNSELASAMNKGAIASALRQRVVYDELLQSPVAQPVILASSTMMTLISQAADVIDYIVANSSIMNALAGSTTGMSAMASNASAMAQLVATQSSFNSLFGNTVARQAIYANDSALAVLSKTTVRDFARALGSYISKSISNGGSTNPVSLGLTGNAILFECALSSTGAMTIANRRVGSTQGNVSAFDPAATTLPGDVNVVPLQSTASVATSTTPAKNSLFGLIYV